MKISCSNCQYWDYWNFSKQKEGNPEIGLCKVKPPVLGRADNGIWPATYHWDWCAYHTKSSIQFCSLNTDKI